MYFLLYNADNAKYTKRK